MAQFESSVKMVPAPVETIFNTLSDLNNLEKIKDKIPADKVKDFSFDADSCSFSVTPVGNLKVVVIEREPYKTIKFGTENSPVPFFMWIQLLPVTDNESKMKLTVKAELNPFIHKMIAKPLQEGLEKMAEVLSNISYH